MQRCRKADAAGLAAGGGGESPWGGAVMKHVTAGVLPTYLMVGMLGKVVLGVLLGGCGCMLGKGPLQGGLRSSLEGGGPEPEEVPQAMAGHLGTLPCLPVVAQLPAGSHRRLGRKGVVAGPGPGPRLLVLHLQAGLVAGQADWGGKGAGQWLQLSPSKDQPPRTARDSPLAGAPSGTCCTQLASSSPQAQSTRPSQRRLRGTNWKVFLQKK